MRLTAAIKNAMVLLAILLVNSIGIVGHATAMSTMPHEMNDMSHGTSNTTSCATLCRTAVVSKDENAIKSDDDEQDNKPVAPFYANGKLPRLDSKSINQQLYAATIKPPPKIPIYIVYGVFRV